MRGSSKTTRPPARIRQGAARSWDDSRGTASRACPAASSKIATSARVLVKGGVWSAVEVANSKSCSVAAMRARRGSEATWSASGPSARDLSCGFQSRLPSGAAALACACGPVQALDEQGTRRLRGVDADARAYLALRPYVARAVRVQVEDPADSTPYWLVSSRRPERLVAALEEARPAR